MELIFSEFAAAMVAPAIAIAPVTTVTNRTPKQPLLSL
jgi:hypothetical protein